MRSLAVVAVLLAAVGTAWQVNLWPDHGTNGEYSSVVPVPVNDALLLMPYVDGAVFAVNTTTQKLMWGKSFTGVEKLIAVPASDVVLVATNEVIFAYDVPTGTLLWVNDTIVALATATPLIVGDTVLFNSYEYDTTNMGIVAFSASTGDVVYSAFASLVYSSQSLVALSPTVAGFTGNTGFVVFDIATGAQLWQMEGTDATFVAGGEGFVAISNTSTNQPQALALNDREVAILNATTGVRVFRFRAMTGAATANRFARIYKGHFYALVNSAALQCYSLTTGTMVWALPLTYASTSNQFQYSGDVMVMATQVYYYQSPTYSIVDALTGDSIIDLTNLPSQTTVSFALVQGVVVAPNSYGFSAYNASNGALLFQNTDVVGMIPSSLLLTRSGLVWSNGTTIFGETF